MIHLLAELQNRVLQALSLLHVRLYLLAKLGSLVLAHTTHPIEQTLISFLRHI
jgi:hypothetical protein